jgi:hypothetical protein
MDQKAPTPKNSAQMIWGCALVLAGVGVFIRIPQVMPKIAQIESFANATGVIRVCFYLMGIFLIGGGIQKVYRYVKSSKPDSNP